MPKTAETLIHRKCYDIVFLVFLVCEIHIFGFIKGNITYAKKGTCTTSAT